MRPARLRIVLSALVCFLVLACGHTLQAAPQSGCQSPPPAPNWFCVGGGWVPPGHPLAPDSAPISPPAQPALQTPPQIINVGEEVTAVLTNQTPLFAFDLTAPADGTLVFHVSWDQRDGSLDIWFEDDPYGGGSYFSPPAIIKYFNVTAGGTYRLTIAETAIWDYLDFVKPFVLTTTIEPGPVVIPTPCQTVQPGFDWVCFSGGWVPLGHPLLANVPTSPPVQPTAVAPPPPTPATGCATPDPFLGIPGLFGVCVNGGWVPVGHPLAGGGG